MKLKIFIVDAFCNERFGGNQAAVVPLMEWLPKETMQKIAAENNLSETAFFVQRENDFDIKWFTPAVEVDLCGHATLASGHVLFTHLNYHNNLIKFNSNSGELSVKKNNDILTLDFPLDYFLPVEAPGKLLKALNVQPSEIYLGRSDYLLIYLGEEQIKRIHPDFTMLNEVRARGVIVTSKGYDVDFVYRFFAPQSGVNEDPATGSAQTTLMRYWGEKLNKTELTSLQLSKRVGKFSSKLKDKRVEISGSAITYLIGEIEI